MPGRPAANPPAAVTLGNLRGRAVGVIGAGKSGIAGAKLLARLGAKVLLSDQAKPKLSLPRGIRLESGGHSSELLKSALLVRSPGVPNHLEILRRALRQGIPLWSELELGASVAHPKHLVAVTGTNGKTTTTTLVGKIFAAAGKTWVGGNIGTPFSDFAERVRSQDAVVLEVSSYQLEDIHT